MQKSHDPTDDDSIDRQTIDDALGAAAYTAVGVLTEMEKRDAYYARDVDEAIEELEAGLEKPGVAETPAGERAAEAVRHLKEFEGAAPDERDFLIRAALADLAPVAADVADHGTFNAGGSTTTDADMDGDAAGDGDIPLLAAAVTAREILQDVDSATVDDDQSGRLLNALEALDNIYIDASPDEIAAAVDDDSPASVSSSSEQWIDTWRPPARSERPTVPLVYPLPAAVVDLAIERFKHKLEYDNAPTRETFLAEYIYDVIDEEHIFFVEGVPLAEYASEAGLESLSIKPDDPGAARDDS